MVCGKRGQAALEFLTTYGWAVLGLLIVIAGVSYYNDFASVRTEQCRLDGGVGCSSVDMVKVNDTQYFVDVTLVNTQRGEKEIRDALIKGPLGDEYCSASAFAGASASPNTFTLEQGLTKTVRFVLEDAVGDCDFATSGLSGLDTESELEVQLFTYSEGDIVSGVVTGTIQTTILETDASYDVTSCQDVGTLCPENCGYSNDGGVTCFQGAGCATLCPEDAPPSISLSLSSGANNLVSLPNVPAESNMQDILQPLLDDGDFNSISDGTTTYFGSDLASLSWNVQDAYYIQVSNNAILTVELEENPLPQFDLTLEAGENLVMIPSGMTSDELFDLVAAGAIYENSLVSVEDAAGNIIERVDGEWVNGITSLSAGDGLIIEVNADVDTEVQWGGTYDQVDIVTLEQGADNHIFIPYDVDLQEYLQPLLDQGWIQEITLNEDGSRIHEDDDNGI